MKTLRFTVNENSADFCPATEIATVLTQTHLGSTSTLFSVHCFKFSESKSFSHTEHNFLTETL